MWMICNRGGLAPQTGPGALPPQRRSAPTDLYHPFRLAPFVAANGGRACAADRPRSAAPTAAQRPYRPLPSFPIGAIRCRQRGAGLRRRQAPERCPHSSAAPLQTSTILSDWRHSLPPTGAGLRRRHGGILHSDSGAAPLQTSAILSDWRHSLPPTGGGLAPQTGPGALPPQRRSAPTASHRSFLWPNLIINIQSSKPTKYDREKQLPHYIKVGQSKRTWGIRRFGVLEDWYKTA